jgi:hypothetical protein
MSEHGTCCDSELYAAGCGGKCMNVTCGWLLVEVIPTSEIAVVTDSLPTTQLLPLQTGSVAFNAICLMHMPRYKMHVHALNFKHHASHRRCLNLRIRISGNQGLPTRQGAIPSRTWPQFVCTTLNAFRLS